MTMSARFVGTLFLAAMALGSAAYADDAAPAIPNPALPSGGAGGDPLCPSANIIGSAMITNICWECIFPIRVGGFEVFGGGYAPPAEAAGDLLCICDDPFGPLPRIGTSIGLWLPTHIYESTYHPGCSPTLGGVSIGIADRRYMGDEGMQEFDLQQQSFNHSHVYTFPATVMLELFTACGFGPGDVDLLFMSEIDPTWNDPQLALYTNPFGAFAASLPAAAACVPDAISASLGFPIDTLFWCAGTWNTTLPPLTGMLHNMGPVQFSAMTSLRTLANSHLRGFQRSHVGDSAQCYPRIDPILNRSHYRWQAIWPRPEGGPLNAIARAFSSADAAASGAPPPDFSAPLDPSALDSTATSNHASGESLLRWGAALTIPSVGELPIYMLWSWQDCCGFPAF